MTQVETVSDANEVLASIADFIDATVRRLEDSGVTDSFLQNEWSAIQAADREEREFCLVAAAWGQDPYDIPAEVGDALVAAGVELGSVDLLADLARAVPLARMGESTNWLKEAVTELQVQNFRVPHFGRHRGLASFSLAPWHLGWEAAQQVRAGLSYPVGEAMPVLDLVQVQQTDSASPGNIDALLQVDGAERLGVVVGSNSTLTAKRFTAARAIGRRSLVTAPRMSLLTRSTGYTERAERAFAAEFLAPSEGVRAVLGGDFSDAAVRRAADRFGVSSALVQHQIDNQLAA